MSLNPIQFGKAVLDQYGRYLRTTFRLSDPRLAAQLAEGLSYGPGSGDRLAKGPYVYLNRPFVQGPGINDLVAEKALGLHAGLEGLFAFSTLHRHQERALRSAVSGRHVLLATGTGSGKTEGFLLPILDYCLKLRDASEPEGVAAVLVYPMNALVNDQRDRLRVLLAGSRIPFGCYTGETGEDAPGGVERLSDPRAYTREELDRAEHRQRPLPLPWEERASRSEILDHPPRLLLTNYSQLEYLLLRDKDLALFRSAPLRFFVLDEIHTYTGALGSQVACLIRRLRSVAGKRPDEVICIGSSATVTDREAAAAEPPLRDFANRLFGVPASTIDVIREEYQRFRPAPGDRYVPPVPTDVLGLLQRVLDSVRDLLVADEVRELPAAVLACAEELCGRPAPPGSDSLARLFDLLAPNRVVEALQEVLTRPTTINEILPRLHPLGDRRTRTAEELQAEVLAYLTLGALARRDDEPLLRPKLHFFVQGLSGLWVRWHEENGELKPRLLFSSRTPGDELALPLSFCRACGQPFIQMYPQAAEAVDVGGGRVVGLRSFTAAGVPPPEEEDEIKGCLLADRLFVAEEEAAAAGKKAYLCRFCGGLHDERVTTCAGQRCRRPGPLLEVQTWNQPISSCPACGARSTERSPIVTLVRSSEVNDVMVLAQTMLASMPEPDLRKVLLFADSRQDAAFQAGWMESRSRRFRLRHLMYRVLAQNPGKRWYFERLIQHVAELAGSGGLLATAGHKHEVDVERLRWLMIEEFFAGSERQRRNSLEQLGLARVDCEGIEPGDLGAFGEGWARDLRVDPSAVAAAVVALVDLLRLKHAVSHELLGRYWTNRDREVREGIVTVGEHYRPQLLVRAPVNERQKAYAVLLHSINRSTSCERLVAAAFPQITGEQIDAFLDGAFDWLAAGGILVSRRIMVLSHGQLQALGGIPDGYQVNVDRIQMRHATERHRCQKCGKAFSHALPSGRCAGYRCEGRTAIEPRDDDHFDVVQYTQQEFVPLLPREHSAQVPRDDRLEAEKEFKRTGGRLNCLVATPTLELGVDIGPLEMVLMRNAPPSPANYAQRSGRAGRRHRIGAVFTYCRNIHHDQYFYDQPPAMIAGDVRVPGFSMRNEPLVRQHVFSTILTELRGRPTAREALESALPTYIWHYFEDHSGDNPRIRATRPTFPQLRAVVGTLEDDLVGSLGQTFATAWPPDDAEVVSDSTLRRWVREMPGELERVAGTLFAEVTSYQRIVNDFARRQLAGEQLDREDAYSRNRHEAAIRRLGGETQDNYSISYLARRGFFPGYALVKDHIRAQSLDPPLDISRPVAVGLRELAPASLLYANRQQYRMSRLEVYRLKAEDPEFSQANLAAEMTTDPDLRRVWLGNGGFEGGEKPGLRFTSLRMIDIGLEGLEQITDQNEYRYRRAYRIHVLQLPEHGGGEYGRVGLVHYRFFRDGNLRMVNLGTYKKGSAMPPDVVGFPICPTCGAVRSPHASAAEIKDFTERHVTTCATSIGWHALHVDLRSDLLVLGPFGHADGAINAMEAIRIGCRRILEMGEMELEGEPLIQEDGSALGVLYDPLPGGSGFLPLAMIHWERIVDAAREVLAACDCSPACYRCLLHFRNQQYHGVLDRQVALDALSEASGVFQKEHGIPAVFAQGAGGAADTESPAEDRLLRILKNRHLPVPEKQFEVDLGGGSRTIADFAYVEERVLIFVDGLSPNIHGNPEQQKRDKLLRTKAEVKGWKVRAISARGLTDESMLDEFLDQLAVLLGREL